MTIPDKAPADSGTKGTVFDIRRFSIHDGEGIRTTVFLKGCPLRCAWCQNPEGLDPRIGLLWFSGTCIYCGACGVRGDPRRFISGAGAETAALDNCPTGALRRDGRIMTAGEVLAELEKDAVFYRRGGGITLSGGEPLAQEDFAAAILGAAKKAGFHTAVESSLYAPGKTVERIAALSDRIFADCKIFNDGDHIAATGVSNRIILDNIAGLLRGPHAERVIIRTPLAPGFTASEENIAAITRFISGLYPPVRYELLNYNPLAAGKYQLTGRDYCFAENPDPYDAEAMETFRNIAKKNGIRRDRILEWT
ncbi:MAG: glycyl-radical enzyme activating protein [Treponema sp.]|jgi:pyruvate formate lyase activating enzyme|nr:glycyl-radical enzyme activating protein [Treponema sp.]